MVEKSLPVTVMKAKKTSKGIGGGKKTGGGGAAAPRGWTQVGKTDLPFHACVGPFRYAHSVMYVLSCMYALLHVCAFVCIPFHACVGPGARIPFFMRV